jgi:hypothetical protein
MMPPALDRPDLEMEKPGPEDMSPTPPLHRSLPAMAETIRRMRGPQKAPAK